MASISKRLEPLYDNEKAGHVSFKNYSLKDISYLLKHFGNPHKKIKAIHVAGTNGKGSVSYMLNSIMMASGYSVGLYTSPHLLRINERIKINNRDISNDALNKYTDEMFDVLDKKNNLRPTYFDALTLFAFRYFYDKGVDIAVIETGLGGRLDSTNVVSPLISIITDISLDHKNVLGNTISEITREKAGIIKRRSHVITSNRKSEVIDILTKKSEENSSKIYILNRDFKIKNIRDAEEKPSMTFDLSINDQLFRDNKSIRDIELRVPGKFQTSNASLAVTSSLLLNKKGFNIQENHIRKGLKRVKIPGRFHIISTNPVIIFDPAHNQHALKATINSLKSIYPNKDYKVITSFMTDKDYLIMFKTLKKSLTEKIFYYELNDERCFRIPEGKTKSTVSIYNGIKTFSSLEDLMNILAREITADSLLFITGSFRLFKTSKSIASMIKNNFSKIGG